MAESGTLDKEKEMNTPHRWFLSLVLLLLAAQWEPAWSQADLLVCDKCVNASDIALDAITSNRIKNGSIRNADIAKNSITGGRIRNESLTSADLKKNSVNSSRIKDGTIRNADIANATISAAKLVDGPGSGLDADTVDGMEADALIDAARGSNPLRVALLRWYDANSSGITFPVGDNPRFMAFDGAHIWVANRFDSTVSKLRVSDGLELGTFAVGDEPIGLAFDGAHVWVANHFGNTVSKLQASDGVELGPFAVGVEPVGVAFDGAHIWVTNGGD
ncbi:MAG TPA: hypothetical protein VLS27_07710, partial [Gammaproteobacteria bacterium]|nr:hypothetical protein [Gammaproteobacteria bacterium]